MEAFKKWKEVARIKVGISEVSNTQEILAKHTSQDRAYIPLQPKDLQLLRKEIDGLLLDYEQGDADQEVKVIAEIIGMIFIHFDTISVLMEKDLNELPIEIVKAISSSILLDSGYFGNDQIISIMFTPSESFEHDRIHLWDRLEVPQMKQLCKSFMLRIDLPPEILEEIENGLPFLEKY